MFGEIKLPDALEFPYLACSGGHKFYPCTVAGISPELLLAR